MKKIIEWLERIKIDLDTHCITWYTLELLDKVLAELKAPPRWETPEQREKRTGKAWQGAVYFNLLAKRDGHSVYIGDKYQTSSIEEVREIIDNLENKQHCREYTPVIICANSDSGKPPDGWRPEENE
jgi:hypothetical protein